MKFDEIVHQLCEEFDSATAKFSALRDKENDDKETITQKTNFGRVESTYSKSSSKLLYKHAFDNNNRLWKEEEYDDKGNITSKYVKEFDDEGRLTHVKLETPGKSGEHDNYEQWYEYDENDQTTLDKKIINGDESTAEITMYEYNDEGACIYYARKERGKDWVKVEYTYDEDGHPRQVEAAKLAKKYNELYEGIFLHSLAYDSIENLLQLIADKSPAEVCVSSVRSNTTISLDEYSRSEIASHINVVGFGEFKELHPFDVWSLPSEKSGKRYTYHDESMSFPYKHEHYKGLHTNLNNSGHEKYYDEGFMPTNTMELVIAVVPSVIRLTNSKSISNRRSIIAGIRKHCPHIQIMNAEQFIQVMRSGKILEVAYQARDKKRAAEAMEEPPHKYEESMKLTFEEFVDV